MQANSKKYLFLFAILAFAFGYRIMLMLWESYPPGADIGLHNSVMHSITVSGQTDFLWNYYQMGGGLSLTFPGYHIFLSQVVFFTGLPDFLAHTVVVALFSTLIVGCAFLLTRKVWSESAAFVVAFLFAFSRFDVEMLFWGGYPNVVALALIPLIFYLFLQRERFRLATFLATTTLLSGALFLTHTLSALVFDGTVLVVVIFAFVFAKKLVVSRKNLALWFLPLFLGALIILPFLVNAAPAFLVNARETAGVVDINLALLSTRILPWEILVPLAMCTILFFIYSKDYSRKFVTFSALLFALWVLVPVAFTQGYLVRFYTDYNRFLYFVILPVIVLVSVVVDHAASFFSRVSDTYLQITKESWLTSKTTRRLAPHLTRKNLYAGFAVTMLLFCFFGVPLFVTAWDMRSMQSFYQVMNDPGYEAIEWAKLSTSPNSVFVSDALYGWWFGGFAQRPTLSAVDPQFLSLAREFNPGKAAKNLLDTDYVIDNNLTQVREDGGYIGRHNPMILAKLNWTYFPYDFLNFNNDETSVLLAEGSVEKYFDLSQLQVTDMHIESNPDNSSASIYVDKRNDLFACSQIVTVYKGLQFVNITYAFEPIAGNVSLNWVNIIFKTKGDSIDQGRTVGFFDAGGKVLGQLIFSKGQPEFYKGGPSLLYTLSGSSEAKFEIWASAFSVSDALTTLEDPQTAERLGEIISQNFGSYLEKGEEYDLDLFDYRAALSEWNVNYVAVRNFEIIPKFARDPRFSLLFINDEVAVFNVK